MNLFRFCRKLTKIPRFHMISIDSMLGKDVVILPGSRIQTSPKPTKCKRIVETTLGSTPTIRRLKLVFLSRFLRSTFRPANSSCSLSVQICAHGDSPCSLCLVVPFGRLFDSRKLKATVIFNFWEPPFQASTNHNEVDKPEGIPTSPPRGWRTKP